MASFASLARTQAPGLKRRLTCNVGPDTAEAKRLMEWESMPLRSRPMLKPRRHRMMRLPWFSRRVMLALRVFRWERSLG